MRLHLPAADARVGRLVLLALSILFALVLFRVARAQSATDAVYRLPDPAIVDVVDGLPTPDVSPSPYRDWTTDQETTR